jgi:hypothetical protein
MDQKSDQKQGTSKSISKHLEGNDINKIVLEPGVGINIRSKDMAQPAEISLSQLNQVRHISDTSPEALVCSRVAASTRSDIITKRASGRSAAAAAAWYTTWAMRPDRQIA